MVQEPLPTADGFDDSVAKGDEDWAQRTAEERVSAAGPAPAASKRFTPLTALRSLLEGVSVNPAEHRWDEHNFIAAESVAGLEAKWVEWAGTAAGDEGQVLPRGGLDSWQGFAYGICEAKAEELECKTQSGHQSSYRAMRMVMTGTAGTGKSRTLRAICGRRRARAWAAGLSAEDVRNSCVLGAPTGCASFQMRFGATTLHRAFGVPVGFCGSTRDRSSPNFVKRLKRLRAASIFVMDEFSLIGRQMFGKICFKVGDALKIRSAPPRLGKM